MFILRRISMKRSIWSAGILAAVAGLAVRPLTGQGVTSAAIAGRLTDDAGAAVTSALVTLTNASTGQRYSTRSSEDGRYFFENVQVGGPYTLDVRALGFESGQVAGIYLRLGQRLGQDLGLKRVAIEVAGGTVEAEANPLVSRARTGAPTLVSHRAIHPLPTLARNFTDFIQTVPQVVTAGVPRATLGGQNNRFNTIQIDGGVNNDVFGLAASGTPGGQANAHPISIEAVREYQVLIAPFDIRQGSFAGGLINAVTKSGTNVFHGSAWGYLQNQNFVGDDTAGVKATDFTQSQYGGSLSGPLYKDRVHFFLSGDLQHREAPFSGQQIGSDPTGGLDSIGVGITQATADRVTQILINNYGFDPGTWRAPTQGNPDKNFFGKITAQLGTNNELEVSNNFVDANTDVLIRNSTATGSRDGYQLSNSGYSFRSKTNTARAKWTATLASRFANELLVRYERALPLRPQGPNADFNVRQYGLYAQDQFTVRPGFTLTVGMRVDVPAMDKPDFNPVLDTSVLRINTANFPSGNPLWSPRLGFNYDLSGDRTNVVRGGIGIFSGRPPYVWVSNAFGNTGLEQATLTCTTAPTMPAFTVDPDNQPATCAGGGAATPPTPSIVYFDSDFRFPQNLKAAIGFDRLLPWGMLGTFDFLYTKAINQFYITDVNLRGILTRESGEGGRAMYGTLAAGTGTASSATATPTRRTSSFRDVLRHENRSDDRSFSVTGQLQKRFGNGVEFDVAYTYSHTQDLFSLTSSIASSNYRFTTLDGTLESRNLRTSVFDIPHKITASGTVDLKFGVQLSLIYIGQSGSPYSYVVSNDINGDAFGSNDPVYVPRNRVDMAMDGNGSGGSQVGFGTTAQQDSAYAILDAFINTEDCLRENRGTLQPRNSCRNPWTNFLNARLTKVIPTVRGHALEVSADLFNVLHLISGDWGLIRSTSTFEQANLLTRTGFDPVNQRGVYALSLPSRRRVDTSLSRWRLQLGVKYTF